MPPTLPPPAPLLSPAERAYIRASLALSPPVRPDGRGPTQFRPLRAETDVLPGTYGSARAAGPDGAEVVVGVKAEVERLDSGTEAPGGSGGYAAQARPTDAPATGEDHDGADEDEELPDWLQLSIDVPGHRDDDDLVVFLSALLAEALAGGVAGWMLHRRLRGGTRWRWKLYVDILLLSPPLSYPVPLLSLATHLALRTTRLPAVRSRRDEDPLFDDDWAAAEPLYPAGTRPPITLLVASIYGGSDGSGGNGSGAVLFDPAREELAVANAVLAVSVGAPARQGAPGKASAAGAFEVLAVRTVDPPARMTAGADVPDVLDLAAQGADAAVADGAGKGRDSEEVETESNETGVWRPPRGGMKPALIAKVVGMCVDKNGVASEVLKSLEGFAGG